MTTDPEETVSQVYRRQSVLWENPVIEVDDGFLISINRGEFFQVVIWVSRDCPAEKFRSEVEEAIWDDWFSHDPKLNPEMCYQIKKECGINGFIKTRRGAILGYGGLDHLCCDTGYIVRFYKAKNEGRWKARFIKMFEHEVEVCTEDENGHLIPQFRYF